MVSLGKTLLPSFLLFLTPLLPFFSWALSQLGFYCCDGARTQPTLGRKHFSPLSGYRPLLREIKPGVTSRNHSGALFTDSPPTRIRIPKASTAHIRMGPPTSILIKNAPIVMHTGLSDGGIVSGEVSPFPSDSSFVSKIKLAQVSCELTYFHSCLLTKKRAYLFLYL